jgi:hypothetical protein
MFDRMRQPPRPHRPERIARLSDLQLIGRDYLPLVCRRCRRSTSFWVPPLVERYGADMPLLDLSLELFGDCHQSDDAEEPCLVSIPI